MARNRSDFLALLATVLPSFKACATALARVRGCAFFRCKEAQQRHPRRAWPRARYSARVVEQVHSFSRVTPGRRRQTTSVARDHHREFSFWALALFLYFFPCAAVFRAQLNSTPRGREEKNCRARSLCCSASPASPLHASSRKSAENKGWEERAQARTRALSSCRGKRKIRGKPKLHSLAAFCRRAAGIGR